MSAIASQITSFSIVYSNRLFRHRSKKTSKPRATGLCEGNPPVSIGFPSQMVSNAEYVSIWWGHHAHFWRNNAQLHVALVYPWILRVTTSFLRSDWHTKNDYCRNFLQHAAWRATATSENEKSFPIISNVKHPRSTALANVHEATVAQLFIFSTLIGRNGPWSAGYEFQWCRCRIPTGKIANVACHYSLKSPLSCDFLVFQNPSSHAWFNMIVIRVGINHDALLVGVVFDGTQHSMISSGRCVPESSRIAFGGIVPTIAR